MNENVLVHFGTCQRYSVDSPGILTDSENII